MKSVPEPTELPTETSSHSSPIDPGTIDGMRSTHRESDPSWAGNRSRRSPRGSGKRWNGISQQRRLRDLDRKDPMKTVVIAGATGFIGSSLAGNLCRDYRVVGLTRRTEMPRFCQDIEWKRCDLFSLIECERALEGADTAFYLAHSMLPSARLTQGSFQDMDLILADNFARAGESSGLRHIVYLGGSSPSANRCPATSEADSRSNNSLDHGRLP
ncbi:MAG: NAD-dependent epimerase/dehydratase family protein [Marinilabiliales bacterium]|nr:NAD-dependent epimerase/dehydratase family protein [Marinilabiliales bacterium]